jgi:hypothetical protein
MPWPAAVTRRVLPCNRMLVSVFISECLVY